MCKVRWDGNNKKGKIFAFIVETVETKCMWVFAKSSQTNHEANDFRSEQKLIYKNPINNLIDILLLKTIILKDSQLNYIYLPM